MSEVIQTAVDIYLSALDASAVEAVLGLEGSISEESAVAMEASMSQTRTAWR